MEGSEYLYKIVIQDDGTAALQKVGQGAEQAEKKMARAKDSSFQLGEGFKRLAETAIATAGIFEGFSFLGNSQDEYLSVKRAQAEIQASLRSTAEIAGVTNEQLSASEDKLFHHSEFTEQNIKNMQAVLLTFPSITKETFDSAQQAIADTAAKLYGSSADLKQVTIQIGKALQDPATGMTMLRREGVNFTKQQVTMAEQMVATGHAADAQRFMIAELTKEFGGSADAAFQASGAQGQMGKVTEDLKLSTGQLVEEIEEDFIPTLKSLVADVKGVVEWGEKHKQLIETTIKIGGSLVLMWGAYTLVIKTAAAADFLFGTSLATLTAGLAESTEAAGAATEGMTALDVAMDANPIGLVASAVAALVIGLRELSNGFDEANAAASKGIVNTGTWMFQNSSGKQQEQMLAAVEAKTQQDREYIDTYNAMLKLNPTAQEKALTDKNKDKEEYISAHIDDIERDLKDQMALGTSYLKAMRTKNTLTGSKPKTSKNPIASTTDVKGQHQVINTFNIKEFGKTDVHAATIEMAKEKIGEAIQTILAEAIMNAQIISGQ